ncbi:hypothetical protein [Arthrobacter sp. AQ5-05]|uniref:hypothetical protein n=1 Tax=Arthrobacter sp. AQ5-05 TaxID=2184581 RepID=UPI0011BF4A25|nr:hypothetical protein [Arthrobacter sp. AQ5-05]
MTKRAALWRLCAVVAGLCLVVAGTIAGISAWLAKHPPALCLAVGDYIYIETLTDEELEGIITERLMDIETVHAVRILERRPDWSMDIEVRMEDADPESDLYWDVQHACDRASSLWNTFLDPVDVECKVLPLAQ